MSTGAPSPSAAGSSISNLACMKFARGCTTHRREEVVVHLLALFIATPLPNRSHKTTCASQLHTSLNEHRPRQGGKRMRFGKKRAATLLEVCTVCSIIALAAALLL